MRTGPAVAALAALSLTALAAARPPAPPPAPPPGPGAGGIHEHRMPPTILVTGRGEVAQRPDTAVVRLGAVAQAQTAAAAHAQVNQAVAASLEKIRALGVPDERISTAALSIYPVYAEQQPRREPVEPRIAAYRASQTIRVELDDLTKVGPVIDTAVASGANQFEGLSFELRNDAEARQQALQRATREAQAKARAMAEALEVGLGDIHQASEQGAVVPVVRPEFMMRTAMMDAAARTPVEPGEIRVEASVTLTYLIAPRGNAVD